MGIEVRLIDANALVSKRFRMHSEFLGTVLVVKAESIENAPTIDPESLRPKAKWLRYTKKINGQDVCFVRCNRCRTERAFDYGLVYCNHCGAKMEG